MSLPGAVNTNNALRDQLLRAMLAERGIANGATADISPHSHSVDIPLSAAQQRMWFAQNMYPETTEYNLLTAVQLAGPLNIAALRASLDQLPARHPILRTRYRRGADGAPIQTVLTTGGIGLSVTDDESPGSGIATDATRRTFDLAEDAPLRAHLAKSGPGRHVLALVLHHIAGDEITWEILLSDLSALYSREIGETADVPPPPRLSYADYAVWEQQRLQAGELNDQLDYWTHRLRPLPPVTGLLAAPPVNPAPAGERRSYPLPATTVTGLRALARSHDATLFMITLAGFSVVLHRYTGVSDLVIGIPALTRNRPEIEDIAGNFANTLALRLDLSGQPAFGELLRRVRLACLDAYANREIPFEAVVERLAPQRTTAQSPLFEVMFAATRPAATQLQLAGVQVTELAPHETTSMFDIAVEVIGGTTLSAVYRTAKHSADTVTQLLDHFATVLSHAAANPDQPITGLPLLTTQQLVQVTETWNATADARYPGNLPLPELIAAQVRRDPAAIAVASDTEQLTYGELDRRAGELAHRLRSLGVGSDDVVAVHLPRCADLVTALLAVLRAGAAFVPIELGWPPARIAEVCAAARVVVVLAHKATKLPQLTAPVVRIDEAVTVPSAPVPMPMARMANLAYVVFTSGSTGTPKGVMVSHNGICNRLLWQAGLLGFGPGDAALHKSPLGFDMGINEIFLPLICGGRVVLAQPGAEADPAYLLAQVARHQVAFIDLVPSLLGSLLERTEFTTATSSLKSVWTGGEVLSPQLLSDFAARTMVPMYHGYGPAEATVASTHEIYRPGSRRHGVTIGIPNANNKVFILDEQLRPVPPGVAGELYIGGVQLARGYIGDPARSAARFIADPVSGVAGARVYGTGDLARFLPNGTIEFLGRADNQLKIRGRRIAPEEVENALAAHAAVRRAVVIAHDDQLLAYCACATPAPSWPELREWLRARLPEYLVPVAGKILDTLPQLPSGKADRHAVRRMPAVEVAPHSVYLPPRHTLERTLAELWSDLLGVPQVGIRDNFFDLGGHSLLLARAQRLLEERLGQTVPLLDLYQHPTVATLAAHLNRSRVAAPVAGLALAESRASAHDRAGRQRAARARRAR